MVCNTIHLISSNPRNVWFPKYSKLFVLTLLPINVAHHLLWIQFVNHQITSPFNLYSSHCLIKLDIYLWENMNWYRPIIGKAVVGAWHLTPQNGSTMHAKVLEWTIELTLFFCQTNKSPKSLLLVYIALNHKNTWSGDWIGSGSLALTDSAIRWSESIRIWRPLNESMKLATVQTRVHWPRKGRHTSH